MSLALIFAVGACGTASTVGGMRATAAKKWSCPEESIDVSNEGQNAYRVSGCGRSALYDCSGDSPAPPGGPPQSDVNAANDYRFQGAGVSCHEASGD